MGANERIVTGTYTVRVAYGVDVVYTGEITTIDSKVNGPAVNYYFVAADRWKELRFLITHFQSDRSDSTTIRPFTLSGTMRKT